jgi:hypothetical protein
MAPAAVKAWKQVLLLLEKQQHAQAHSKQRDIPAARQLSSEIDELFAQLNSCVIIPRAAWKIIIRDMEVSRSVKPLINYSILRLLNNKTTSLGFGWRQPSLLEAC